MRFDPNNPEHIQLLQDIELQQIMAARENPGDFMEYVYREQTTGLPVICAPHQRIGIDFMHAHREAVLIWPAGASKTSTTAMQCLYMIGKDPTLRGLVLSATREQAEKTVSVVSDYILHSPQYHAVFPHVRRSRGESWTQDSITVARPKGIPDATLKSCGFDGGIAGSRLNFIMVDDLLTRENTATAEQRKKIIEFFDSTVTARLDTSGGRIFVNNTAWHPEDLVHFLEKGGWATLRMTITGDVSVKDSRKRMLKGLEPWDHPMLTPKYDSGSDYTLRIVRPGVDDSDHSVPLFPERFFACPWHDEETGETYPPAKTMEEAIERAHWDIANKRARHVVGSEFNRLYMGVTRDNETAFCKTEWIEECKRLAREARHFSMVSELRGPNPTFTGVDLAFSQKEEADETAFFTFEVLPNRKRRILDIEIGRWDAPTVVRKCVDKHKRYNSVLTIESNAGQDMVRQMVRQMDESVPVKGYTTGRSKAHPEFGVQSGFAEMSNGLWLIPNDKFGVCHPHVQKWIDGCLYYTPSKHTADSVMAWFFAREQAKQWGLLNPAPKTGTKPRNLGINQR